MSVNITPTREELELVREYVLLPIMLTIVEGNRREIEYSMYSLKKLYLAAADALLDRIHADLVRVRKELRQRDIKVYETDRVDTAIHYEFVCRGYRNQFALMRFVVKTEVSVRLGKYIGSLLKNSR